LDCSLWVEAAVWDVEAAGRWAGAMLVDAAEDGGYCRHRIAPRAERAAPQGVTGDILLRTGSME